MMRFCMGGFAVAGALLFGGCGRSGVLKIVELPVTGKVTLDGQPVAGATVTFQSNATLSTFMAVTGPDGVYHLQTADLRAGDCQGPCRVSISRFLKPGGVALGQEEVPFLVGAVESLPPRTATLESTMLTADVPAGGGTFDFSLAKL
ncbi:MAG TPA: carboxypeptidase-like regulatory domain-containing protein [Pirellulales bacterium]|nr:carboxypeptidase-like regulatory domain-containing protein [Pirellulales bacterium]